MIYKTRNNCKTVTESNLINVIRNLANLLSRKYFLAQTLTALL